MALAFADRVRETTTTTGTGTITLAGAVTGYQSFSAIGDGNTTYYTINAGSQWEVGIGTYTASGTTLSRDTVLSSSNAGSLVDFSAGTKDVFVGYPAGKVVIQDASGNVGIGTASPAGKFSSNTGANGTYVSVPGNVTGWDATTSLFGAANSTTGAAVGIGMTAAGGYISSLAPSVAWQNLHYQASTHYWYNGVTQLGVLNTAGDFTAVGSVRAPIFYDSANTAYYLDPTGSTSLNVAGNMLASGNLTLNNGANRYVRIGSATNYSYDLQTTGDDFQIIEAGTTPRLTIKYPNGYVGIGTSSPSVQLQINGSQPQIQWSNPTTGATSNDGTHLYLSSSDFWLVNKEAAAMVFATNNTEQVRITSAGNVGIGTSSPSTKLHVAGSADIRMTNTANTAGFDVGLLGGSADANAYVYQRASASLVFGTSNLERMRIASSGSVTANVDLRAPIFYDSNDTAYYIDAAGNNVLNTLYFRTGSVQAKFAQASNFGYSASYRTVVLGNEYLTTISMGVDVSGNASGSFNGQGEGREVIFRNGVNFITPNSANNSYLNPFSMADGYAYSPNSLRAPIFYDTDNTGYYVDPAGTSNLNALTLAGTINNAGVYGRSAAGIGYLSGGYNGAETNSTTGPIYCISTGYAPTSTTLGSMYGIGYTDAGSAGVWSGGGWGMYAAAGGVARVFLDAANGIMHSTASVRSPVFYDSNDTGYYVDPAAGSKLRGMLQVEGDHNDTEIRLTALGSTLGSGQTSAMSWWVSEPNVTWNDGGFGFNVTNDGGTPNGFGRLNTSFGQAYTRYTTSGNMLFYCTNTGGTRYNVLELNSGNYVQVHASDIRAPIFYDSSNTGYYLDPASSGTALVLGGTATMAGGLAVYDGGAGNDPYGKIAVTRSTGGNYTYYALTRAGQMVYGMGIDTSNQFWIGGSTAGYDGVRSGNPYLSLGTAGDVTALASFRAPIFYDSNDTSWYVDPSSSSLVNVVYGSAWYYRVDGNYGFIGANVFADTVNSGYASDPLELCYVRGTGVNIGTGGGNLPIRADIFYEGTNTAYYVDPASTTTSIQVAGAVEQGNNYAHPQIEWSSSSATGMVIFYLPGTTSNYGMVHMVFDIYEYVTGKTATVIIGGHNWSTSWYNTGVQVVGWTDKTVRLGVKNGRFCVIFGGVGSSWTYGTIRLRKIHNASFYDNIMDLGGNWSTELTNTESFTTVTSDLRQLRTSNTFTADGDVRSPIFYDSSNTAYYLDPASTSLLNEVKGYRFYNPQGVSSDDPFGLYFSSDLSTAYAIYREAGAWTHPYPDLRIAFHTGIKMGANASYGGMKFYTDYDMSSQVMSINNAADGLGGGYVYVNDALQAGGSLRAPIFYDSNNTGYYLDASSTSTSLNVAGAIVAAGNVTAYSDIRVKDNVETVPAALAKLSAIRGVTYTRTDLDDKERRYAGVIAQEIEQVLPEAIFGDEHTKTVDYNATIALLIQAVKELSAEVQLLKAKEY